MDELNRKEAEHSQIAEGCNWVPEYGAWMVEATPNRPYTGFSTDLLRVERNMRLRRKRIMTVLTKNEIAPIYEHPVFLIKIVIFLCELIYPQVFFSTLLMIYQRKLRPLRNM